MFQKIREKLKWLDPFTYVDLYLMPVVNPKKSEAVSLIVYVVCAFVFAFIIFNALGLLLGTSSPMVIVVSSSMEPVLFRGDIVVLSGVNPESLRAPQVDLDLVLVDSLSLNSFAKTFCAQNGSTIETDCSSFPRACPANYNTTSIEMGGKKIPVNTLGDIIVYKSNTLGEPIIHRVVAKINASDGYYFLTKGDNVCNPKIDADAGINRGAVSLKNVGGKALFWIPKIGCLKLWVFDDIPSIVLGGKLPRDFSGIC